AGFHKGAAAPFGGWGIGGKVRTEALTTEPEHETEYQPKPDPIKSNQTSTQTQSDMLSPVLPLKSKKERNL
ncbi:hypothetical protein, partial [Yersinia aleksiciae]|uniref:hypothetical protein n=1 Tax=Yersinia aleksiciae TaxID=263819 RepID=UPI000AD2E6C4